MACSLQNFLDESGLTVADLAEQLVVSESTIYNYLRGTSIPKAKAVRLSALSHGKLGVIDLMFPKGVPANARLLADGTPDEPDAT